MKQLLFAFVLFVQVSFGQLNMYPSATIGPNNQENQFPHWMGIAWPSAGNATYNSADQTQFLLALANKARYYSSIDTGVIDETLVQTLTGRIGGWTQGSVLAENDCIYGIPSDDGPILKLNTLTDIVTKITGPASGLQTWAAGAYYYNHKIYCAPFNATSILVINTSNDTFYYIDTTGVLGGATGNLTGSQKYFACYVGADGWIYFCPFDATSWMGLDPSNESIHFFDTTGEISGISGNLPAGDKCDSGEVWGDYIYGGTSTSQAIHKINTRTHVASVSSNVFPVGTNKWAITTLAKNEKLYMAPYNATYFETIDPNNSDAIAAPSGLSGITNPGVGLLAIRLMINGKLLAGRANVTAMEINTATETYNPITTSFLDGSHNACTIARNGSLYFLPRVGDKVVKLSYHWWPGDTLPWDFVLSRYNNGY